MARRKRPGRLSVPDLVKFEEAGPGAWAGSRDAPLFQLAARALVAEQALHDAMSLRAYVAKVIVRQNDVEIQLTDEARQPSTKAQLSAVQDKAERAIKVPVTMKLAASGKAIVSFDGSAPQEGRVDKALLRAVARANRWRELLESGVARSAYDLARHESCRVSYVQRHLPLAFLAPDIVEAIVAGRQPRSWMLSDMVTDTACLSWTGYRPK